MVGPPRHPHPLRTRSGWRAGWLPRVVWLAVAGFTAFAGFCVADDDANADDENPYRPGAIARYTGSDGRQHVRLQAQISLACGDRPPDRRVGPGPFDAVFEAQLLVQSPGVHRLSVYASGHVRVTLAGKTVLDGHRREPGWLAAEPIDVPFGFHPLEVHYRRENEPARLNLFWEGPNFASEPLAARWLFHEASDAPSDEFERGRQLTRALRCAACHAIPGEIDPLPAGALDSLAGNISRAWIIDRLSGAAGDAAWRNRTSRNMPHFALARGDAAAVADYLLSASRTIDVPPAAKPALPKPTKAQKKAQKNVDEKPEAPNATAGAELFRSVGCLACHRVGGLGADGLFGGGDLSAIATKRPPDFFARWLTNPAALNRHHRMPTFALGPLEVAHLSLYLQSLGEPHEPDAEPETASAARGAQLVRELRCGACHAVPRDGKSSPHRLPLEVATVNRDEDHCLLTADGPRPGYALDDESRRAVSTYLQGVAHLRKAVEPGGRELLLERNCLACHARGTADGLRPHLAALAEVDPNLHTALPLLIPPSLVGVGDKLLDESLSAAIETSGRPRQSYLRVRMPKFALTERETATLARHFIDVDRIPERPHAKLRDRPASTDAEIEGAGARLVTAEGFGCTSCHAIGSWTPVKVAPGAEGADLSMLGRRVRQEWFERWVRNPVRFVPEMEMPSIVTPVRGVLDEDLDRQIAAIWNVLNRKRFTPPDPSALRVVRRTNLPGEIERVAVLTDVIEVDDVPFVKPLVLGFGNRHNVLYDLATGRLAAWWTGDVARQRTRGKSWFWQAGVPQLLSVDNGQSDAAVCELVLLRDGQEYHAVPRGQYITEFDTLTHVASGVELTHRLHYPLDDRTATVHVTQTFAAGTSGFRRRVIVDSLPRDASGQLLALPGNVELDESKTAAGLSGPGPALRVVLRSPADARFVKTARGAVVELSGRKGQPVSCELDYRATIAVDRFPPLPVVDRRVERAELDVVPGFEAVRLPLSDRCMPTGFAWRPDGTLIVSSLEGRVWLARDTDDDGLEDELAPLSDDLAAPFGVAAAGDAIDVINKYGLLRLFDADGDGHAERIETLASGWGHTRDYHDWAIGLPRDPEGNYYVSLPCQQDDRSESAAALRGTIVKLVPREPTPEDPRRFTIEEICAGLRFGQGIARSRAGELFVSDHQGNYNPFNELNHVIQGTRYGFINKLEAKRGMKPSAHRSPAIEIPHPWTRSINGICFLETPAELREASGELFGPFEGHLIGCEYDTRRLVRMSLERVGDGFQGAAYPLSSEPAAGSETFEGPITAGVAPDGEVYIGSIRDSGWGAGSNTGSIVRLRFRGDLPPGIAEVRVRPAGFTIDFAAAVDRNLAADAANYSVSSYRRISTPAYGGPDVDRRVEKIKHVEVSDDRRQAIIELGPLREGFVYEFHLRNLVREGEFFPSEAHYTLRRRAE